MSQIPTPAASSANRMRSSAGSQRLDRLIPLGDVGAGAERADDVSLVIPQHVLRHSISRSSPDLVRTGFSTTGQIAAEQAVELLFGVSSRIRAGRHVSIQSRPSNSSAVHPRTEHA